MTKIWKNVKNSDFLVNMKYAVFCCFWIICIWHKCGKCDILQDLYGGNVNFVIVENIFTNNMMKVGSIMTSNLLIKLCGYRLYSVSPSLDQLDDESAANQIGRSWFWGALSGDLLYRGELQVSTCTCRRHMYMQGQRRVLCPLVQDQWRLYLMEWVLQENSHQDVPA